MWVKPQLKKRTRKNEGEESEKNDNKIQQQVWLCVRSIICNPFGDDQLNLSHKQKKYYNHNNNNIAVILAIRPFEWIKVDTKRDRARIVLSARICSCSHKNR